MLKKKIKTIICDNSMFMREKIKMLLKDAGCEVAAECPNGLDALEVFRTLKPDLVTMDIVMPKKRGLDGMGALREIMKVDPHAKVLMVTSVSKEHILNKCMRSGAAGYLRKPLNKEMVTKKIKEIFYG